jgi:hypothetical protein
VAQWLPGGGLGRDQENLPRLRRFAAAIHAGDHGAAGRDLENYRQKEVDT